MRWRPLGLVYACDDYAQTPTPLVMADRIRMYVASRKDGKAFIRYVDLDLDDPTKVIEVSGRVLENGKPGTFDDEGQMPSFAEADGHNVTLYYSGWNTRNTVPYHNASGKAYSENGGRTFFRKEDGPWLDRTQHEPYLRVTPCKADWRCWYVSGLRWEEIAGKFEPIYVIRALDRQNPIAIPQNDPRECFSRPWVVRDGDLWRMWYCCRWAEDYRDGIGSYRLGYADSIDGEAWHRRDGESESDVERMGFDKTMQCYPAVFDVKGKRFMAYNGNGFGRGGFALAVAE